MYAIVKTSGKQYKVTEGATLVVNKLEGAEGDAITLDSVLALGTDKGLVTGDAAAKASVSAKIVAQGKDEKVIVFKKKRRHNYRRKIGHRQMISTLEITSINAEGGKAPAAAKKAAPKKADDAKAEEKKPAAKKAPAKKPAAKKAATDKPAAKKAPAKKAAPKKPAAKKTAEKKEDK